MEIHQQTRIHGLARKLVRTIRTSKAPCDWGGKSVILAHRAVEEYMPIAEEELRAALPDEIAKYGERKPFNKTA